MRLIEKILIGGILAGVICGCSSVHSGALMAPPAKPTQIQIRNNAASLLYDLLNDEQNVDKVLIVKKASPDVEALIKLIAANAATDRSELGGLATNDPALNLQVMDLPPGETAAREATARTQEHDLLLSTGANFEFNLLYSQAEAQSYGSQLAGVAAKNAERPDEVQTFDHISKDMNQFDQQVLSELRSLPPN